MKLNRVIITSGIISLLLLQNVNADVKNNISPQRNQSKSRSTLINRVQNDIERLQNRQDHQHQAKKLDNSNVTNVYEPGHIKIDTSKRNLHATIITREEDKKESNSKSNFKEQNLSKIEMESKATELNIEYKRRQLQQENDSLK